MKMRRSYCKDTKCSRTVHCGVIIIWLRQKSRSPRPVSCVAARKIVRRQSWDPTNYSLVVDEDVKKPNKQTKDNDVTIYANTLICREQVDCLLLLCHFKIDTMEITLIITICPTISKSRFQGN